MFLDNIMMNNFFKALSATLMCISVIFTGAASAATKVNQDHEVLLVTPQVLQAKSTGNNPNEPPKF